MSVTSEEGFYGWVGVLSFLQRKLAAEHFPCGALVSGETLYFNWQQAQRPAGWEVIVCSTRATAPQGLSPLGFLGILEPLGNCREPEISLIIYTILLPL